MYELLHGHEAAALRVGKHKRGTPSSGCTVRNNLVSALHADGEGMIVDHNLNVGDPAAVFVDPSTREDKIMDLFQKKGSQLAVVRDPKKGYLGVVTLEDVLEELVGEIRDEHEMLQNMPTQPC